jgi:ABC-type iron transport system FetAB permease component
MASADILRAAVRAGMIPAVNSHMAVGRVWCALPGMMTGQILGGCDPFPGHTLSNRGDDHESSAPRR